MCCVHLFTATGSDEGVLQRFALFSDLVGTATKSYRGFELEPSCSARVEFIHLDDFSLSGRGEALIVESHRCADLLENLVCNVPALETIVFSINDVAGCMHHDGVKADEERSLSQPEYQRQRFHLRYIIFTRGPMCTLVRHCGFRDLERGCRLLYMMSVVRISRLINWFIHRKKSLFTTIYVLPR